MFIFLTNSEKWRRIWIANFFENNRQVNLRLYAGSFYINTNSGFLVSRWDRPTDYLWLWLALKVLVSLAINREGGLNQARQPMQPMDYDIERRLQHMELGRNIWNLGFIKNKAKRTVFLYDSGIRLNLVPDYFELYLPSIRLTAGTK
jgi:hypothetical protein